MQHIFEMKTYVSETDAGGVVYFANYSKYGEHARSEFYASLGFKQMDMLNKLGIGFMVVTTTVDYKAPALFEDKLIITTNLTEVSKSKFSVSHKIFKNTLESKAITLITATLVCVNAKTLRPTAIPEAISDALKNYVV